MTTQVLTNRLDDAALLDFIAKGYHLVTPSVAPELHASIHAQAEALTGNPGNGILDAIPDLNLIYQNEAVTGALASILGPNYEMSGHRHCHVRTPGANSQGWHQDGTNVRHHQVHTVLAMYYPHDVPVDMGPTIVMPGSHFRNAPTDRMQSYCNLMGQKPLTVDAGTVAITHYDLWHAGTGNRTQKNRYMFKFLFDRADAPDTTQWQHNPDTADTVACASFKQHVGPPLHTSDYYKEWQLRLDMWQWYCGKNDEPIPGIFNKLLAY